MLFAASERCFLKQLQAETIVLTVTVQVLINVSPSEEFSENFGAIIQFIVSAVP